MQSLQEPAAPAGLPCAAAALLQALASGVVGPHDASTPFLHSILQTLQPLMPGGRDRGACCSPPRPSGHTEPKGASSCHCLLLLPALI